MTDERMVEGCRRNDPAAQKALYQLYARKMMAELDKRSIMSPEMKKLLAGITPANMQDDEGYSVEEVR